MRSWVSTSVRRHCILAKVPVGRTCPPRHAAPQADAFDIWLQVTLRGCFDAVANEPVPEDLLRLIEEDRAERDRLRQRRQGQRNG